MQADQFGEGPGPVTLLLHGAPTAPLEYFQPLIDALSPSRRLLLPDSPGYGRSAPLPPPYSLARLEAETEQMLLDHCVREVDVVGFSFGAFRGLSLALSSRVRVRKAVLMGAFAVLTDEHRAAFHGLASTLRAKSSFDPALRQSLPAGMLAPAALAANPSLAKQIDRWLDATTPQVLSDELEAVTGPTRFDPRLASLQVPILLRVGALDAATPAAYSEGLAKLLPRATLQVVPGCGHALLLEDAPETVRAILEFLG